MQLNHDTAREWLETQLSGPNLFCFAWQTITAFLRIESTYEFANVIKGPLQMALESSNKTARPRWAFVREKSLNQNYRSRLLARCP
jgi:hypothetical protein